MTTKDKVWAKYPGAEAKHVPKVGDTDPTQLTWGIVYKGVPIGLGVTEEAAWEDALAFMEGR